MNETRTISATEFKATCLDLLDRVGSGEIGLLTITKRGKPVAVVSAPRPEQNPFDVLYGMMKGCVIAPDDFDFAAPAFEGVMEAAMEDPPETDCE